jgi:MOSC domain-containing protein YiiM
LTPSFPGARASSVSRRVVEDGFRTGALAAPLASRDPEGLMAEVRVAGYIGRATRRATRIETRERPQPVVAVLVTRMPVTPAGQLISVNVGRPREFEFDGRHARSAIWKTPVSGRIRVAGVNLEGDDQADREAHGGADKAVYAYAVEDLRWWEQELARPLPRGQFGENLTTAGIAVNLGVRMEDPRFPRRFTKALRPGAYLRIVVEGDVGAGDEIEVVERPDHALTIRDVLRIYAFDRDELGRLVTVPQLSDGWRSWARELLEASQGR